MCYLPAAFFGRMPDSATLRILDASLNRAGEGLRIVEDYVRFVLDDRYLTSELKSLRHELGAVARSIPSRERQVVRDTRQDVGTLISTESERSRRSLWDVCAASLQRAEQSLRSLEEYGKLFDTAFATGMESLRYRLYTLEKAIQVGQVSRERLEGINLCILVDGRDSPEAFQALVRELVSADVGMIQLRDKRLADRELVGRARQLRQVTRGTRTLCAINDRADIAAAVLADAVHLGQEDLTVKDARAVVGVQMLIGVSTHNIQQARAAVLDGANYLGAGPTFPSTTKNFETFAGLNYLRQVAGEIRLPTFAIGGINAHNLPDALGTGITRVAVGNAVTGAADAHAAASNLLNSLSAASQPNPAWR